MSDIDVKVDRLKTRAYDEQNIAKQIRKISKSIENVADKLQADSDAMRQIRKNLQKCSSNIESTSDKVKILGETLSEIAVLYQNAEKDISGKKGVKEAIQDAIDKIADTIRNLKGSLGMDKASAYSDDPVNLCNGNYVFERTMFDFDTVIPMNLRFFYNIQDEREGVLGQGWMHNFEKRLVLETDRVYVLDEDGTELSFVERNNVYIPVEGTHGELSGIQEGYLFIDDNQVNTKFDKNGKMTEISTVDGWKVTLEYVDDRLTRVYCTDQIELLFEYNNSGKLVSVRDHADRKVELKYKKDMLSVMTDPEGNSVRYQYNDNSELAAIQGETGETVLKNHYDERKRTVKQEFPDGGTVFYKYDDAQKLVTMTRQNGSEVHYYHDAYFRNTKTVYTDGEEVTEYNPDHQKTVFVDKAGNTTRYAYNYKGKLASVINPLGDTMEMKYNENGKVTQLLLNGNLIQSSKYDEKNRQIESYDANGAKVSFAYDELGRPVEIIHEDGSISTLEYNERGNIICASDPRSGKTEYEYDACQHVIKSIDALGQVTRYEYDKMDRLTKVINAKGEYQEYEYDAKGNLTKTRKFNGGIEKTEYNAINKPSKYTDADGNTTRFVYDQMWHVIRKELPDGAVYKYDYDLEGRLNYIEDPMGGIERAEYDAMGNLVKKIAQDGAVYSFGYDALNRMVEMTDPFGETKQAVYDAQGNLLEMIHEDGTRESATYDLKGNRLTHTDQTGYTKYFTYDALGNLLEVKDSKGTLAKYEYLPGGILYRETNEDLSTVTYSYDAAGNVIRIEDDKKGTHEFIYDELGNVSKVQYGDVVEEYEYDAFGNILSVVNDKGEKKEYKYSKAGALTFVREANGMETAYEYDPCYRLKKILQSEDGMIHPEQLKKYNLSQKKLRITEYKYDLNGNVISICASDGTKTEYEYDSCGRVIRKTDGDNHFVNCEYRPDGMDDLITFSDGRSIKYQYDALRRLIAIEDWLGITRFERDAKGRVVKTRDHNDQTIQYVWGNRDECKEIIYPDGKKTVYDYNERRQLIKSQMCDHVVNYAYYENSKLKEKCFDGVFATKYSYDALGRISELGHFQDDKMLNHFTYEYDACNRKSKIVEKHDNPELESGEFTYSYNAIGALEKVERNGVLYQEYRYDNWGNRTSFDNNGSLTTYEYDQWGRLLNSTNDTHKISYKYDNRGNLCETSVNGMKKLTLHFDALNRLSEAVSGEERTVYQYNGMAKLAQRQIFKDGTCQSEDYFYDYGRNNNSLIAVCKDNMWENHLWDTGLVSTMTDDAVVSYFMDERMNPVSVIEDGRVADRRRYDPFGQMCSGMIEEKQKNSFAFTGYRVDSTTGFLDANMRQYDCTTGRFISCDPMAGILMAPVTMNPYLYCTSDPVNQYDPTGLIAIWLAGGIVGTLVNTGARLVGDTITSISKREWSFSSPQEYAGSIVGGFVEGVTLTVAGPAAAGGAGAATETLVTNGLNMVTGVKGYRKEDGYTVGSLFADAGVSAALGATLGYAFDKVSDFIKIPKLETGQGSWGSRIKQVMTKAKKGIIKNITGKTMFISGVLQGIDKTIENIIKEGASAAYEWFKDTFSLDASSTSASLIALLGGKGNAKCPLL